MRLLSISILFFLPPSLAQLSCHRIPTSFCCTSRIRDQCPEQCANVQCGEEFIHSLFSIDGSPRTAQAKDGSANIGGGGGGHIQSSSASGPMISESGPEFTFTQVAKPDSVAPNSGDARVLNSGFTTPSAITNFPTLIPSTSAMGWEVTTPRHLPEPPASVPPGFEVSAGTATATPRLRNGHRRRTTPDPRIIRPPESLVVIGDYDEDEPPSENAVVDSQIPLSTFTTSVPFAPPPPAPTRVQPFDPSASSSAFVNGGNPNFGGEPSIPDSVGSGGSFFRSRKEIVGSEQTEDQNQNQKGEVLNSGTAVTSTGANRESRFFRRGLYSRSSPSAFQKQKHITSRLICRITTPGRLMCNRPVQNRSRYVSLPSRHPVWRGDIRKQPPNRNQMKKRKNFTTNRIHISPYSGGGELLRRRRKLDSGGSPGEWKVSLIPRGQVHTPSTSVKSIPVFTIDGKSDERFNKFYRTIDKVIHKLELTPSGNLHVRGETTNPEPTPHTKSEGRSSDSNVESSAVIIVPRTTVAPGSTNKVNVLPFRPIHFTSAPPQPPSVFINPSPLQPPPPPQPSPSQLGQCGIAPEFAPCVSNEVASRSLLECCKRKNLPIGCQSLCRYDITQAEIRAAMDRGQCGIFNVAPFLECASQGRDNSECCRYRGIIQKTGPQCEQFCRPTQGLSALGIQHIVCGNAVGDMLHCHHSGIRE